MKALITGANGFLGRHVVAAMQARGHAVRAMVRPATNVTRLGWGDDIELVRGDLRNSRELEQAFDGVDVLIHLAATVVGDEESQLAETVVGTTRLLQAMIKTSCKRLVLAGSMSVYDWDVARGTLTEDTPLAGNLYQRDGYAIAKTWQERVARQFADESQLQLTVLRPGFIWGKGNDYLACLGVSIGPVHLVIGPRTRLPLTHVQNCATAFALAAEMPEAIGKTFNVVDPDVVRAWRYTGAYLRGTQTRGVRVPVPYRAFLIATHLAQGMSRRIFNGKGKLPSLFVPCRFKARFKPLAFSSQKLRNTLGWQPLMTFAEAADTTWIASETESSPCDVIPAMESAV